MLNPPYNKWFDLYQIYNTDYYIILIIDDKKNPTWVKLTHREGLESFKE